MTRLVQLLWNLPRFLAILLVLLYQKLLSPFLPPSCRFTPSCSEYGIEAFREHGFLAGLGLTVWRILRCNPFCTGGLDPVPPNLRRRNEPHD